MHQKQPYIHSLLFLLPVHYGIIKFLEKLEKLNKLRFLLKTFYNKIYLYIYIHKKRKRIISLHSIFFRDKHLLRQSWTICINTDKLNLKIRENPKIQTFYTGSVTPLSSFETWSVSNEFIEGRQTEREEKGGWEKRKG